MRTLVKALEVATPPGPDLIHRPPPTAVATSSDVQRLWDGGLHPDVAEAISPFLLNSLPLPVTTWIKIAAKGIDLDWLRHISAAGPQAVVWAAHTYSVANPRVTRHFIRAATRRSRATAPGAAPCSGMNQTPYERSSRERTAT